jgi:hypothetical protein
MQRNANIMKDQILHVRAYCTYEPYFVKLPFIHRVWVFKVYCLSRNNNCQPTYKHNFFFILLVSPSHCLNSKNWFQRIILSNNYIYNIWKFDSCLSYSIFYWNKIMERRGNCYLSFYFQHEVYETKFFEWQFGNPSTNFAIVVTQHLFSVKCQLNKNMSFHFFLSVTPFKKLEYLKMLKSCSVIQI